MPPRRKSRKRRSPRKISLINLAESYAYASILTGGIANASPWQFITGRADIRVGQ